MYGAACRSGVGSYGTEINPIFRYGHGGGGIPRKIGVAQGPQGII